MKTCNKCGESKPTAEFHKNSSRRDGLQSRCKSCHGIECAKWAAANPEKYRAYTAKWRAANPEKNRASDAKTRAARREKSRVYAVEYRANNPEKAKAAVDKWCAANPKAHCAYNQNRRARKREVGGNLSKGLAGKLFKLQRGKCACGCGQHLGDDYHLDHIMPIALGGSNTDDNIQLLRQQCNNRKHSKHPIDFMQQRGFLL